MIYNILVIFLLILMLFFQGVFKQNKYIKITYLFLCSILLGLLSAFRFETGLSDFRNNYLGFIRASEMSLIEIITSYDEFGHMVLRKTMSLFTDNPQWYFVITGFFIVISFFIFIYRYSPNIYLSVLIFVTIGGYFTSHNITRQFIAISICLYAFSYLISRKQFKYIAVVLLAMTFHTSAIIMIPLYYLAKLKMNYKTILMYFITITTTVVGYDFIFPYIHQFIYSDSYQGEGYGTTTANMLNIFLPVLLLIVLSFLYREEKTKVKCSSTIDYITSREYLLNNTLIHMGILSFFLSLLSVTNMLILSRLANYFTVSYLLIIPIAIQYSSKKFRPLFYFLVITILVLYFVISNYLGRLTPTPYTPFWWY